MPISFILIIMALGLIGAGAVTLTKKSWGRIPLRSESIIKKREADIHQLTTNMSDAHQEENTPAETTAQECELEKKERDIIDEFIDPATPEKRKRELARKLVDAGIQIKGKYAPEEQKCEQAIKNESPVETVGTEDGDNVVSMKQEKRQENLNNTQTEKQAEEGTNVVSMHPKKPVQDTVDLEEFGVIDQNEKISARLRS